MSTQPPGPVRHRLSTIREAKLGPEAPPGKRLHGDGGQGTGGISNAGGSGIDVGALRYWYLRRVVGTAMEAIGLEPAMRVARWLARGIWELEGPARVRALERCRAAASAPGLERGEPEEIVRGCYEQAAMFWVESLFARRRLRARNWRRCIRLEDEAALRAISEGPRPAVFVTGYMGHPGVGAFALGQLCRPIHVLVDVLAHPVLRAWQEDLYRQPNVLLVSREASVVKLPVILEAGGKVLLIGEHARHDGKGDEVTFLGRKRRCYQTVRLLSQRYGAPVVVFGCVRASDRFEFAIHLGGTVQPGSAQVTQQVMSLLERLILDHPEQYLWTIRDR